MLVLTVTAYSYNVFDPYKLPQRLARMIVVERYRRWPSNINLIRQLSWGLLVPIKPPCISLIVCSQLATDLFHFVGTSEECQISDEKDTSLYWYSFWHRLKLMRSVSPRKMQRLSYVKTLFEKMHMYCKGAAYKQLGDGSQGDSLPARELKSLIHEPSLLLCTLKAPTL